MNPLQHETYRADVQRVLRCDLPWDRLRGKTLLLVGATGMIGSCLADVLLLANQTKRLGLQLIAMGRSEQRLAARLGTPGVEAGLRFLCKDVNTPWGDELGDEPVHYILHLASNTHPRAYAQQPISTITANVIGLHHLLELACRQHTQRFLFASSVEVYGENRSGQGSFAEADMGYLDSNTMRAGYPESKRVGEALCQAYRVERGIDVVVPRLSRTYGPTMLPTDSKALSQFIAKAVKGEDIVLKSEGTQLYSYTYVTDAVSALLRCLLEGENGVAYNVADPASDVQLRDVAALLAATAGTQVRFELPDAVERAGYSTVTRATLNPARMQALGWQPEVHLPEGTAHTVEVLRHLGWQPSA